MTEVRENVRRAQPIEAAPTHDGQARVRFGSWPYDPAVIQIVLLDHHMVPTVAMVHTWIERVRRHGAAIVRTGAMFPAAADVFRQAGFHTIDTLALLEAPVESTGPATARRLGRRLGMNGDTVGPRPLRRAHFAAAAHVDHLAFGERWANDAASLIDIAAATAHCHARRVTTDTTGLVGFAISGHSGRVGYLQRLAVHPDARRRGIADMLVTDAIKWMHRQGATTAMVNTGLDNEAALALYARHGFLRRPDTLAMLEFAIDTTDRVTPPDTGSVHECR